MIKKTDWLAIKSTIDNASNWKSLFNKECFVSGIIHYVSGIIKKKVKQSISFVQHYTTVNIYWVDSVW